MDFYNAHKENDRRAEDWQDAGSTQMNFHEVQTTLVYLDIDIRLRDAMGHMIRPMAERWAGIRPLE